MSYRWSCEWGGVLKYRFINGERCLFLSFSVFSVHEFSHYAPLNSFLPQIVLAEGGLWLLALSGSHPVTQPSRQSPLPEPAISSYTSSQLPQEEKGDTPAFGALAPTPINVPPSAECRRQPLSVTVYPPTLLLHGATLFCCKKLIIWTCQK